MKIIPRERRTYLYSATMTKKVTDILYFIVIKIPIVTWENNQLSFILKHCTICYLSILEGRVDRRQKGKKIISDCRYIKSKTLFLFFSNSNSKV